MTTATPTIARPGLGWLAQRPDFRDRVYAAPHQGATLPSAIDLRPQAVPVEDQGHLGACTAFMAGRLFREARRAMYGWTDNEPQSAHTPQGEDFTISHLYEYFWSRFLLDPNLVPVDSGSTCRDAIKVLNQYGACAWHNYPYDIIKFALQPPAAAQVNASHREATSYFAVPQTLDAIKLCLTEPHPKGGRTGYPVGFGFTVYDSFFGVGIDGDVPLPLPGETVAGGHAITIEGCDDARQCFIVANQWGAVWGDRGWCYMPYAYLLNPNLASDFWTVRTVTR